MEKRTSIALGLLLFALLVAASFLYAQRPADADSSTPITGYAWSDTIGWISMSGSLPGQGTYGFTINSGGVLSGYAWSDNVGWISANSSDLSGCPSAPCTAKIQNGNLTGWLRALAGETGSTGGWDGWISLSGTSPTYGVTLNETTGNFSGYAWGSTNVGWVDWEYAHSGFSEVPPCQNTQGNYCADSSGNPNSTGPQIWNRTAQCATSYVNTCAYQCSSGGCIAPPAPGGGLPGGSPITATPSLLPTGTTATIAWNVTNVQSCTVSGDNGDGPWSGASGSHTSSEISTQTIYTVSCTDLGGNPFSASVTIDVIPVFREI